MQRVRLPLRSSPMHRLRGQRALHELFERPTPRGAGQHVTEFAHNFVFER